MTDINVIFNSDGGKLIKKYLENTIDKLKDISDIDKTLPVEQIGIIVLSRLNAKEILDQIILESSDGEVKFPKVDLRKKYGLEE